MTEDVDKFDGDKRQIVNEEILLQDQTMVELVSIISSKKRSKNELNMHFMLQSKDDEEKGV